VASQSPAHRGPVRFLLTKFGEPKPWSKDEVLVYTAQLRKGLANPRYHFYHKA
jgi:hypothetical protein